MFLSIEASLRQFARAVLGDRLAGDELVRVTLSELERGGQILFSDKPEAFRQFVVKWRAASRSEAGRAAAFTDAALLESMGPPPDESRLVLLLGDVVGFSAREIEAILDPLSRPYEELLAEGRNAVNMQKQGRAVIVEDEPLIAADLAELLESMGLSVAGVARTAESAATLAAKERPDIVLADYNLEGRKTGVDAMRDMQESHDCPIVFITGYPDRVLAGDEIEPDFVIVKPYRPDAVRTAVAHCLETSRFAVVE